MGGWMTYCHWSFTRRKKEISKKGGKKKGRRKKSDIICGQYTNNACKLNANWDKQKIKNYTSLSQQPYFFPIFYVVETCSKFDYWFQILPSSNI